MLTSRAWWFLFSVLLILGMGLGKPSLPLTLVGLALLLWFGWQWLLFLVRLPGLRRLSVAREVWEEKASVATLWAGQEFEVRVRLSTSEGLPSSHLAAADHVPYAVAHLDGSTVAQGTLTVREPLEWSYRIRCGPAGLARFEGVRVQAADWQGFFCAVHFVRAALVLPV